MKEKKIIDLALKLAQENEILRDDNTRLRQVIDELLRIIKELEEEKKKS